MFIIAHTEHKIKKDGVQFVLKCHVGDYSAVYRSVAGPPHPYSSSSELVLLARVNFLRKASCSYSLLWSNKKSQWLIILNKSILR